MLKSIHIEWVFSYSPHQWLYRFVSYGEEVANAGVACADDLTVVVKCTMHLRRQTPSVYACFVDCKLSLVN